jgi:hypothetical protein
LRRGAGGGWESSDGDSLAGVIPGGASGSRCRDRAISRLSGAFHSRRGGRDPRKRAPRRAEDRGREGTPAGTEPRWLVSNTSWNLRDRIGFVWNSSFINPIGQAVIAEDPGAGVPGGDFRCVGTDAGHADLGDQPIPLAVGEPEPRPRQVPLLISPSRRSAVPPHGPSA